MLKVGALVAGVAATPLSNSGAAAAPTGRAFRHGVASGDPFPDSVLLWTRVTPSEDATPGSGNGPDVAVRWEVATDEQFRQVVARGSLRTGARRDHTVKVDVRGLNPATRYWYRFRCGAETSPVGRTRTAPAGGAAVSRLRMGVVSCSNWQAGHFAAYRHLARRDDLDLVLHLGDYLYRRFTFGGLAQLSMLDLRTYRSKQASGPADPDIDDPARTITGDAQMTWLTNGVTTTEAQWKLIGNPVMIAPVRFPSNLSTRDRQALHELTGTPPVEGVPYNVDQWDGYTADRAELFSTLRRNGVHNTVFLTGDIHSA